MPTAESSSPHHAAVAVNRRKDMKFRALLLTAALAACAPVTWSATPEIRQEQVQFDKGRTGASAKGSLRGRQAVDYRLAARAGQIMDVALTTNRSTAYFNVLPPGPGGKAIFVGSNNGDRYSGAVAADGEYTIRVYQLGDAAARDLVTTYRLDIDLSDRPVSAAGGSAPPAKYDESGRLPCSEGRDSLDRSCEFRVVRNASAQSAQVWISFGQAGRTRLLHYAGRRFTTDDGAGITARRDGDAWRVGVGSREFYKIPDALLNGS